jgi:squalene-hopene/tetraprenyl-beta-curcumene cyclase
MKNKYVSLVSSVVGFSVCATAFAAPVAAKRLHVNSKAAMSPDVATRAGVSIKKGLAYLVSQQRADGAWEAFGQPNPAITALVVKAIAQDRAFGSDHPVVKRGLAYVLKFVQEDGGIYVPGQGMRNYYTSVSLMALSSMKDKQHASAIRGSQRFLKKLQWDAGEGHEANSNWYGGAGYGKHKRPDLSNTQLMLEALHQSGLPADDPAFQKAMKFITRCQLMGETNDQEFAKGSRDGGFVYTAANGGESKAGVETVDSDTRLRSYGSMTYAGFKSMLYADVDRNDPRVVAAMKWIREHYTLDHNPNMPGKDAKQGLYYYYHVFARALVAWGEDTIEDGTGFPHRWRVELCEKLMSLQRTDGSWINEADRWYEGNPHLVTAYAILSMQAALLE